MSEYIRNIDALCQSTLPIERALIDEARTELKREKWIKKFYDLQLPSQQNVRIKQLDSLFREFRASGDLQNDTQCTELAQQLERQHKACLQWKEQLDGLFNEQGQFDPRQGNEQIAGLLQKGKALELRL